MPTTTAGRLLTSLSKDSSTLLEHVIEAAAITAGSAQAAMAGNYRFTLAEQLRLAEATLALAPAFRRRALALKSQALAAHSYEHGDVVRHASPPPRMWERSLTLRR